MPHGVALITTIAVGLGLALILGFVAVRLRLSALVGYLLAGVLIGPATPGFVADVDLARQLSEIGVMLLMFGVGLHFSLDDLLAVRRIAVAGALVQIAVATALGAALAMSWGWGIAASTVFGLALSVASTVVLLRALEQRGLMRSLDGRIAVGWLLVEDLVMVLAIVLLPALVAKGASPESGAGTTVFVVALTLGKVGLFGALMLVVGRRVLPWLLWQVARTNSRELFTLCVITCGIGIAYGAAQLFGVSFALGAFLAGMVLRESHLSHRTAEESLPLRDAFSVLFFVAVGMLFDPGIVARQPLRVLAVVAVVMIGKSLAAFALVRLFRYPLGTALTLAASLAQIGEFSFILAGFGVALGLLPEDAQSLILAAALVSIALNAAFFGALARVRAWLETKPRATWLGRFGRALDHSPDPLAVLPDAIAAEALSGHVVLVGYGRVGRRIGEALRAHGVSLVVAEQNRELVEDLRRRGVSAVSGDASEVEVLVQTHVARARLLVTAVPDAVRSRRMLELARMLQPGIATVARSHSEEEAELLRREGAGAVFEGEEELAQSMIRHLKTRLSVEEAPR